MHTGLRHKALVYSSIYVYLVAFFLLTVNSGDDFGKLSLAAQIEVGSSSFLMINSEFYSDINGRVLGNGLHLLSAFSFIANALLRAAITLGIIWAITRITRLNIFPSQLVILFAILVPSVSILKQAVVWSAGFYNYVTPVFLVLLAYVIYRDASGNWSLPTLAIIAFSSSLFMETVTLGLLSFSWLLLAYNLVKQRANWRMAAIAAGSLIGAGVMFLSPAYRKVLAGHDSYRPMFSTDNGILDAFAGRIAINLPQLAQHLVVDLALFFLVTATVFALIANKVESSGTLCGIMLGSAVSLLFVSEVGIKTLGGRLEILGAATAVALYLVFAVSAFCLLWRLRVPSARLAAGWVAAGTLVASPLLIVSPFGPRNFFITSTFYTLAACTVAAPHLTQWIQRKSVNRSIIVAVVVVASTLLGMLATNKVVSLRNHSLATELYLAGSEHIELRKYPFPSLVQDPHNGKKFRLSLQPLECQHTGCNELREVEVTYS